MKERVRVTAIVPVKNGSRYLPTFLTNLTKICSELDEILLIDDNSADDTYVELLKFAAGKTNFKILKATGNGLVDALNQGISLAKNDWLARFDCDDIYNLERLNFQSDYVQKDTVCIFSDYIIQGKSGEHLGYIPSPIFPLPTKLSLVTNQRTAHPVALMRRESVILVGGYRSEDFPAEDLSLWIRLSQIGSLVTVPEPLLLYTLNSNSVTGLRYQESKEKAHNLYQQSRISENEIRFAIRNFKNQSENYSNTTFANQREFLHYVDIYRNMRINYFPIGNTLAFLIFNFDIKYLVSAFNLYLGFRKRRRYRIANPSIG